MYFVGNITYYKGNFGLFRSRPLAAFERPINWPAPSPRPKYPPSSLQSTASTQIARLQTNPMQSKAAAAGLNEYLHDKCCFLFTSMPTYLMEWTLLALYAAQEIFIVIERRPQRSFLRSRVRITNHVHVVCTPVK